MPSDTPQDAVLVGVSATAIDESPCDADYRVENDSNNSLENFTGGNATDCTDSAMEGTAREDNDAGKHTAGDNDDAEIISRIPVPDCSSRISELQAVQLQHIHTNNEVILHVDRDGTLRSNYTSAHMSTLGTDSDRMDFCARSHLSKDSDEQCERRTMSQDDTNSVVSLKNIRKWFSSSSSPGKDLDNACNGDYHKFGSQNHDRSIEVKDRAVLESNKNNTKYTLNDNDYDESLLNNNRRNLGQKIRITSPWVKQSIGAVHHSPILVGTEEEERVMGECSFFYNNMDDTHMILSQQRMPGTRSIVQSLQGRNENEQEEDDHLEHSQDLHHHYHDRTRRLDPLTLSNAIKTRAKRQWTERRYRRRLRQSQLGMVSFDGTAGGENMLSKSNNSHGRSRRRLLRVRRDDSSTSFWHTKEHQRAFLAAHSALNGKLAYENGHNNNQRRNTSYEYDIDNDDYYDLELAITQDEDAEDGGESTRAYVTKSSLAIRGGLIRLPTDNVRLVCDPTLQPGILSIETRELTTTTAASGVRGGLQGGKYENFGNGVRMLDCPLPQSPSISNNAQGTIEHCSGSLNDRRKQPNNSQQLSQQNQKQSQLWSRQELAYVLTVDERVYQRVVQEMGDSYRIPCGMYYCCHVTTGGDHVGIGVAVAILSLMFLLLIAGMIAWPTV